jgi:hypothetical protein
MDKPFGRCCMCGKEVALGERYLRCTVSACNSGRFKLLFCGPDCWNAHLPTARHRKAAYSEHIAGAEE